MKLKNLINISAYIIKILILFFILYFTFESPTSLVYIAYLSPILYILLYILVLYFLSNLPILSNTEPFFKRHILRPLLSLLGVAVMFFGLYSIRYTGSTYESYRLKNFINNADETIPYSINSVYPSGIKNTSFTTNTILIDYDTHKIGFLYYAGYDRFVVFDLTKSNENIDNNNIQIDVKLNSPGYSLTTFYPEKDLTHRTSDIQIIMENGEIYTISNLKEKDSGFYYFLNLDPWCIKNNNNE